MDFLSRNKIAKCFKYLNIIRIVESGFNIVIGTVQIPLLHQRMPAHFPMEPRQAQNE